MRLSSDTINVKKIILYGLIFLFAYSISGAVFSIMTERTLGSVFRNLMATTPYLVLIILFSIFDVRKFSFASLVPNIHSKINLNLFLKRYSLIILLTVLIGLFSVNNLIHIASLNVTIILAVIVSLLSAFYFFISEKPFYGIVMFLLAYPFLYFLQMNHKDLGFDTYPLIISDTRIPLSILYLLIIFFFFFISKDQKRTRYISNNTRGFVTLSVIFILIPIVSTIFAIKPFNSSIHYIYGVLIPFMYFYILIKSLKNIKELKIFIIVLVFFVSFYELFALYYRYQAAGLSAVTNFYGGQYSIEFLGYYPTILPPLIVLQIALFNLLTGWKKILISLLILLFITLAVTSNVRSVMLELIVIGIVFLYYNRINSTKKIYVSVIVLLCLVIPILYFQNFIEVVLLHRVGITVQELSLGESIINVSSKRIQIWQSAIEMIRDFPILGIGPGMWHKHIPQYSYAQYFHTDKFGNLVRYYSADPHNIYMSIWLNFGIAGLVFFFVILYKAVKMGIRNIKDSSSNLVNIISVASYAALIGLIFSSFFTEKVIGFSDQPNMIFVLVFWSNIAIILKLNEFITTPNEHSILL